MILTEQISARLSTVGSAKDLRLCMNLTKDHINAFNLENNTYTTVHKYDGQDGLYIAKFHNKAHPSAHPWKIKLEKENGVLRGATLQLNPIKFGLNKDEKVLGVPLEVAPTPEGLVFKLVPEEFVPRARAEVKRITTPDEKEAAGFARDSSWGLALDQKVDAGIRKKQRKSLLARLVVDDDF